MKSGRKIHEERIIVHNIEALGFHVYEYHFYFDASYDMLVYRWMGKRGSLPSRKILS